jgi:hypothetical protein
MEQSGMMDLALITGFDWDDGNARKNEKHGVSVSEAEQVFFNQPLLLLDDVKHSQDEPCGSMHSGSNPQRPVATPHLHAAGRTQED